MTTNGTTTGPELRARLDALFGPVATTDKAAEALHVTRRTVDRWVAGDVLVPGPVVAWLELNDQFTHWRQSLHLSTKVGHRVHRTVHGD